MNEDVYMYINKALSLFTVKVGVTETRPHLTSESMCIPQRTPLTDEGHIT